MKKIYITPEMEEFKMESVNPIAASDPKYGGPGGGSGDAPFQQDWDEELDNLTDFDINSLLF